MSSEADSVNRHSLVYLGSSHPIVGTLVCGRHRDCDVQIKDESASRRHLELTVIAAGKRVQVTDLDSANGTLLNGQKLIGSSMLNHGDRLQIGNSFIVYQDAQHKKDKATITVRRTPEQLIGKTIGNIELLSLIGAGRTGQLFKAHQKSLDRAVAMKIFYQQLVENDGAFKEELLQEARKAGKLDHRGIAQIHDCGHDDDVLWLATELVEGTSLKQIVQRDGRCQLPMALLIVDKLCDILGHAHQLGLSHGDLNPQNIMINEQGHIKVLDFGVAGALQQARQTAERTALIGTPHFMSPERAAGGPIDFANDLYAVGCLFFFACSGRTPYSGNTAVDIVQAHRDAEVPSLTQLMPELPPAVDELVEGLLAKNPAWRYQDINEVREIIQTIRQTDDQSLGHTTSNQSALATPAQSKQQPAAQATSAQQTTANVQRFRTPRSNNRAAVRRKQNSTTSALLFVMIFVTVGLAGFWLIKGHLLPEQLEQPEKTSSSLAEAHSSVGSVDNRLSEQHHTATNDLHAETIDNQALHAHQSSPADLISRWSQVQSKLAQLNQQGLWSDGEFALRSFIKDASAAQHPLTQSAQLRLKQWLLAADQAYQQTIITLPPLAAETLAARLQTISQLRRQTTSPQRADINSRYQQCLDRLDVLLASAQREAQQLLEQGRFDQLDALGQRAASWVQGTPVAGLVDRFRAQLREVSALHWQGDLPSTARYYQKAQHSDGELALKSAALLAILGNQDASQHVLLQPHVADNPALSARRQQLFSGNAILLEFLDATDLFFIDSTRDLSVDNGQFSGPATCRWSTNVPIHGADWEALITFNSQLPQSQDDAAQTQLSINQDGDALLSVRWDRKETQIMIEHQGSQQFIREESFISGGNAEPQHLAIRCYQGSLTILLNDQVIGQHLAMTPLDNALLQWDSLDMSWSIHRLHVLSLQ